MSLADSLYNLQLVQEFCKNNLNHCCHFTLEDMLYAHASIKVSRRPTRRGKSCLRNMDRVQSRKKDFGESGNVRTGKSEWSEVNHAKKSLIIKACE